MSQRIGRNNSNFLDGREYDYLLNIFQNELLKIGLLNKSKTRNEVFCGTCLKSANYPGIFSDRFPMFRSVVGNPKPKNSISTGRS